MTRRLGPYELLEEIGRGAEGVVYLARRPDLQRDFAIKVLRSDGALDESGEARFRREASVASRLSHPGVVGVYSIATERGVVYSVMEHCPGGTLHERLRRSGPLPARDAAQILLALAEAVAHAHEHGVIHRDLKPANVILTERGPRITDFGLARDAQARMSLTVTGEVLGTPLYMAPEQVRGEVADARSDVYALGVILYECLCGQPPHPGKTRTEVVTAKLEHEPPPPSTVFPGVPPELDAMCARAMAKQPADRYSSATLLADDVRGWLSASEVEPLASGANAWPRAVGLALGLVLGLTAVSGFVRGCGPSATEATESAPNSTPDPEPAPVAVPEPPPPPEPPAFHEPEPPGASQRVEERLAMVANQLDRPPGGRVAILDPRILEVFRTVPRHAFVPSQLASEAYADRSLPNYENRRISQPYILAFMIELLEVKPEHKVLELGTSSGYQAAVLAHLSPEVYTVEPNKGLQEHVENVLFDQGYGRVYSRHGDPYLGWPEAAPFDRILFTGAVPELPPAVWEQLKPGGRIVLPLGAVGTRQALLVVSKTTSGEREDTPAGSLSFSALPRGSGEPR